MGSLENALEKVIDASQILGDALLPFKEEIEMISLKPFEQVGVSDRIKIAKALLRVRTKQVE